MLDGGRVWNRPARGIAGRGETPAASSPQPARLRRRERVVTPSCRCARRRRARPRRARPRRARRRRARRRRARRRRARRRRAPCPQAGSAAGGGAARRDAGVGGPRPRR
ncbi:MAG: hypothetical protein FJ137_00305 [Deltaproteobacteria bacterium]|nr:hypothetical protein [Deltaproteobacteria bacterium]